MRARFVVLCVALTVAVTGCAVVQTTQSGGWDSTAPVFGADVVGPVLATSPVTGLSVRTEQVSVHSLASETTAPGLVQQLSASGFLGGRERVFQGASKDLSMVLSRSLMFSSAAGAQRYLDYVRSHAEELFGLTTERVPINSAGRLGWAFTSPQCACPKAQPLIIGVLHDGDRLVWLSINGPMATLQRIQALLIAPTSTS